MCTVYRVTTVMMDLQLSCPDGRAGFIACAYKNDMMGATALYPRGFPPSANDSLARYLRLCPHIFNISPVRPSDTMQVKMPARLYELRRHNMRGKKKGRCRVPVRPSSVALEVYHVRPFVRLLQPRVPPAFS
ncbi:hypothetical protein C8Q73DRAFT_70468 [Cubamyces lactineus]|nr:hypothetical protein C8Q73DRAFT_70468 [Cubamyces lactineus]